MHTNRLYTYIGLSTILDNDRLTNAHLENVQNDVTRFFKGYLDYD